MSESTVPRGRLTRVSNRSTLMCGRTDLPWLAVFSWTEIFLALWCLGLTVVVIALAVALTNWMRRYERFRSECGTLFLDQTTRLDSHDSRLAGLGSPTPRAFADRMTTMSEDEVWARRSS